MFLLATLLALDCLHLRIFNAYWVQKPLHAVFVASCHYMFAPLQSLQLYLITLLTSGQYNISVSLSKVITLNLRSYLLVPASPYPRKNEIWKVQ